MNKTKVVNLFDRTKAQKQERKVAVRFKLEKKRKDDKRFYAFTTWIERTSQDD